MNDRPILFSDVFPNYHPWKQLQSIRELIDIVFTWRNDLHGEISEEESTARRICARPDTSAEYKQVVAESLNDRYWDSAYRDAVAVQAAVGALAPFIEGFFVHAFEYLRRLHGSGEAPNDHPRWRRPEPWNPRKPNGLISGLRELRNVLSLREWLDDNRLNTLELLFMFRNRSLHFAYEWPCDDLESFKNRVEKRGWSEHIDWAFSGGTRWMAYLKDSFLTRAIEVTDGILQGFVSVAKSRGGRFLDDPNSMRWFDVE